MKIYSDKEIKFISDAPNKLYFNDITEKLDEARKRGNTCFSCIMPINFMENCDNKIVQKI